MLSGNVAWTHDEVKQAQQSARDQIGKFMVQHFHEVTWDVLHRDARLLARQLIDLGPIWDGIIAVTRGGMIPAAIIARELQLRVIETVSIVTYGQGGAGETDAGKPEIVKWPSPAAVMAHGAGFLIVDDLVDTGATARLVRAVLPRAHFACVYAKPAGAPLVDTFAHEVKQDTWILFPWETEPLLSE